MGAHDALLWDSARARALIAARDVGGVVRLARQARGWRQSDLGKAAGYSASTISRLETGRRGSSDVDMLRRVTRAAGIPPDVLGALLGIPNPVPATVAVTTSRPAEDDGSSGAYTRLATCYDVATEALNKIGRYGASRITADRATLEATTRLEATGLATPAQSAAFAQMLCTCAYNAAQAADRERALELIADAEQAARALLAAHRQAPAEVHDRPSILTIVANLAARHPRVAGVRELAAAVSEQAWISRSRSEGNRLSR
jgi:transcriptional regulator with XRE-family HTH domain